MRRIFVPAMVAMLLIAAVAGCTKEESPPAVTTTPAPTITTGTLEGQTPPAAPVSAEAIPTVVNRIGYQIFPVNPAPALTFSGKACTLEDLQKYQESGQPFECAIVYDEEMGSMGVYVSGP